MTKKTFCITLITIGVFAIIATLLILICARNSQASNYDALNYQKQLVMNDFNNVYSLDNYTIEEKHDKIAVTLRSRELSATCFFDKEHNFIEAYSDISLLDNHVFSTLLIGLSALIISIMVSALFAGLKHCRFKT